MKNIIILIGMLFLLCSCVIVGEEKTITISFDSNGGSQINDIIVNSNNIINGIEYPIKDDNNFLGWFLDNETFLVPFSAHTLLDSNIKEDFTVYALWEEITYLSSDVSLTISNASLTEDNEFLIEIIEDVSSYDFKQTVSINQSASFEVFLDSECLEKVNLSIVNLDYDLNEFYILVTAENMDTRVYKILIDKTPFFNITFDYLSGSGSVLEKAVKYKETFGDLPLAINSGYNFIGWSINSNQVDLVSETDIYDYQTDIVLYAVYEITVDLQAALVVIERIDSLPVSITLAEEIEVNQVEALYQALTLSQQNLVNNYDILSQALAKILLLKDNDYALLTQAIEEIGTHITRKIVMPDTVDWSYKVLVDQTIFDITTGELKQNIFGVKYITLIATSKTDNTKSLEATINVGLLSDGEKALCYHNASTVVKDYNWIGYTVTKTYTVNDEVKKDVLFLINEVIFVEGHSGLVDSSVITTRGSNIWHSSGSVIVNKGSNDISFNLNQTGETFELRLAVIVDTDNTIVNMYDNPNTLVTLKPNQFIWLARYLDTLSAFNMAKITSFSTTTSLELKLLQERMFLNTAEYALKEITKEIGVSETLQLKLTQSGFSGDVIYTSSNEAVAIVNSNALVTAVSAGSATITATLVSDTNVKATFTVVVN